MNLSLPTKTIISALAIIVSFVFTNGAQAGRPLIDTEDHCKAVAEYYGKSWGGSGNYDTKGCYYYEQGKYAGKVYYGKGGWPHNQNANTGSQFKATGKKRFDQLCMHRGYYGYVGRTNVRKKAPWEERISSKNGYVPYHGWGGCDCWNRETKGC